MSHFHFWKSVCFCPKCGVRSLLRDMDKQGHHREGESQISDGTEWWCTTCGFGFKIGKSRKWHIADELTRRDRQQRVGKFSDNTTEATRKSFLEFLERNSNGV